MLAHDAAPNRHRLFGQLGQSIYEAGQGMPIFLPVSRCPPFGIVYGVLSSAVFSAKSVANSYVAAISSGNYDKANTIADPHVDTNQRALLTSKASSGENTRITNARISQTSNNADGTVSAQLTYTLEGKEVNGNFTIKDNKVSVEFSE